MNWERRLKVTCIECLLYSGSQTLLLRFKCLIYSYANEGGHLCYRETGSITRDTSDVKKIFYEPHEESDNILGNMVNIAYI